MLERAGEAGREVDEGALAPGALGHLAVELAALLGRELPLEVREEPLPPHRSERRSTAPLPPRRARSRVIRMQTSSNDIKRMFRGAAVAGIVTAGAGGAAAWLAAEAMDCATAWAAGVPLSPAAALTGVAPGVAAAGLAWLVLGAVLEVLARLPGAVGRTAAALSAAVSPRVVRRAAAVLLGVGLGAGASVGPATAAPDRAPTVVASLGVLSATVSPQPPDPAWAPLPDPGWVPEAPRVRPQPDVAAVSTLGRRTATAENAEIVVHRGDSLWTIAARHLGPGAGDGEVAAEWPRWYAANRTVIGEDPDLLLPGQVLRAPAPAPEDPR